MTEQITTDQLLERFAQIQNISVKDAQKLVGANTVEGILNNITQFTKAKIQTENRPMNRKQRRALAKKLGKKGRSKAEIVADAAEKLNYIDLIQKLRALNEKQEKEINENEATSEND